jgi:glycosyltransferase involved in cell wall biosynthesis
MNDLTIVFPAFNEAESICKTIYEYRLEFPSAKLVVVDNNSTDKTVKLVLDLISNGFQDLILMVETRQGKGAAMRAAFTKHDSLWWIMADADNTYPADEMRRLFDKVVTERADMGVLDRITKRTYQNNSSLKTCLHLYGNKIFTNLLRMVTGSKFMDILSGGRVLSKAFVDTLTIEDDGFELETEMNIHSSNLKISPIELPSNYRTRLENSKSKLHPIIDGLKIFRKIIIAAFKFNLSLVMMLLGVVLGLIAFFMVMHIFGTYLTLGYYPHTSYAVATAILILISVLIILFSINIQINYANSRNLIMIEFLKIRRSFFC